MILPNSFHRILLLLVSVPKVVDVNIFHQLLLMKGSSQSSHPPPATRSVRRRRNHRPLVGLSPQFAIRLQLASLPIRVRSSGVPIAVAQLPGYLGSCYLLFTEEKVGSGMDSEVSVGDVIKAGGLGRFSMFIKTLPN